MLRAFDTVADDLGEAGYQTRWGRPFPATNWKVSGRPGAERSSPHRGRPPTEPTTSSHRSVILDASDTALPPLPAPAIIRLPCHVELCVHLDGSTYSAHVIEIGSRARTLPAPPHIVWDSLVEPHRPETHPWLSLLADEVEPRVLTAQKPSHATWSSLWPSRPHDQIHFTLTASPDGGTLLRFTLLTPDEAPDQSKTGHLRKRLNQLLFADLRYSYGH